MGSVHNGSKAIFECNQSLCSVRLSLSEVRCFIANLIFFIMCLRTSSAHPTAAWSVMAGKNPLVYGISHDDIKNDRELVQKRIELISTAARALDKARMVRFDETNGYSCGESGHWHAQCTYTWEINRCVGCNVTWISLSGTSTQPIWGAWPATSTSRWRASSSSTTKCRRWVLDDCACVYVCVCMFACVCV